MARRPPLTFTAAALVLVLAILVAMASRGAPVWTLVRPGPADSWRVLAGVGILCGLGILLGGAITFVVHRSLVATRPDAPPFRTTLLNSLPLLAVILTATSLAAIARADLARPSAHDRPTHAAESSDRQALPGIQSWGDSPVRAGEGAPDRSGGAASEPDPRIPLPLVVAAAVALAFAGAAAWLWRARGSGPVEDADVDAPPDSEREAMRSTVADVIEAMLADPDPATAIRGAYARLLEGLAECGTPRRAHEAPLEHLRRVLTTLRVRPAPLRELVNLFEIARFSTHPLKPSHRERALDALRAVAADLQPDSAWVRSA